MNTQLRRLLMAAMISGACFAATYFWYRSQEGSSITSAEDAIALIKDTNNKAQKRPASSLSWWNLSVNDPLYNGDTIKTPSEGKVTIQFYDGRYIDVDPESIIVIQRSQGEVALDLVSGSLFVNAQMDTGGEASSEKAAPSVGGLVLKSKNGKIDLTGASASLTKSENKDLQLQVLEGKAKIENKDGKTEELKTGAGVKVGDSGVKKEAFQVTFSSPQSLKPYSIFTDNNTGVNFQWQGLPGQYKSALWVGKSHTDLKLKQELPAGQNKSSLFLPLGEHFYKLVAMDPSKNNAVIYETPVAKFEVIERTPTVVKFPYANQEIEKEKYPADVIFMWERPKDATQVSLEVFNDAQMSKSIFTKNFATEDQATVKDLVAGEYYWRVKTTFADLPKPHVSRTQKFNLKQKFIEPPKPPVRISWALPKEKNTQYFLNQPELELAWLPENRKEDVFAWSVQVAEENGDPTKAIKKQVKQPTEKVAVTKGGRYIASIEALDKEGKSIGQLNQTLELMELPLLKPPKVATEKPNYIFTNTGIVNVNWDKNPMADEYKICIKYNNSAEDKCALTKSNAFVIRGPDTKGLKPGKHFVTVTAKDKYGRWGESGQKIEIEASAENNLNAPKLKGFKIQQ